MKIAVLDFSLHHTHAVFNSYFILSLLKLQHEVFVATNEENIKKEIIGESDMIHYVSLSKGSSNRKNLNSARIDVLKRQREQYNLLIKGKKIDAIIILNFSSILFGFAKKIYDSKIKIYALVHSVDTLQPRPLFKFFSTKKLIDCYKNKINFIVLEEFEKTFMVETMQFNSKNIFVVPWIIKPQWLEKSEQNEEDKKKVIALSLSNDENMIVKLIEYEKEKQYFIKNKISFVIKSLKYNFSDGFLTVYNDFLSDENYIKLYNECKTVVTLFPTSFGVRVSGTTIEAVAKHKYIIASDIPLMRDILHKYPSIGDIYYNVEDLILKIENSFTKKTDEEDMNRFIKAHSICAMEKAVEQISQTMLENNLQKKL